MGFGNPLVDVRVILNAAAADVLTLYTGDAGETAPATLTADVAGGGTPQADQARLALVAPLVGSAASPASVALLAESRDGGASDGSAVEVAADRITLGSVAAIVAGDGLELTDAGLTLAGIPIRPMTSGRLAVITDVNGYVAVPHGLGYIPSHVSLGIFAPLCATDDLARLAVPCQYYAPSSTVIAVRFRRIDTGAWFSGAQTIGLQWSAA